MLLLLLLHGDIQGHALFVHVFRILLLLLLLLLIEGDVAELEADFTVDDGLLNPDLLHSVSLVS